MFDPVTVGLVLQLLGAITAYLQEKRHQSEGEAALDYQDFENYLREQNQTDLLEALAQNLQASQEIKKLITLDSQLLIEHLGGIEERVVYAIQGSGQVGNLAGALRPDLDLPEISRKILTGFGKGAEAMLIVRHSAGNTLIFQGGGADNIDPTAAERQLLDDDLEYLCKLGYLSRSVTPKGADKYKVTRPGLQYYQANIAADS